MDAGLLRVEGRAIAGCDIRWSNASNASEYFVESAPRQQPSFWAAARGEETRSMRAMEEGAKVGWLQQRGGSLVKNTRNAIPRSLPARRQAVASRYHQRCSVADQPFIQDGQRQALLRQNNTVPFKKPGRKR
jgi:hypothetical protein